MATKCRPVFRISALASSFAVALAPPLAAQTIAYTLPEVTVSATRERRDVDETTSTVTVIPAQEIDERFVKDIRDLVRNEPGVTVRRAPARFGAALGATGRDGNAGFNIRGLEGNRVLIQVDGIRVPAAFSFGASNFGRGGYTDVSTVRSVEILRGPASSLYGSDGLAGVVSFYTFDPLDLLGDQPWHASAAASYASEDESTTLSLRGAARVAGSASAGTELMAVATGRYAHELKNFGANEEANSRRTAPNPQDNKTAALLVKAVQRLSPDAQLRLTVERVDTSIEADVLSGRSPPPVSATGVLRLDANDHIERTRASADAVFERLGFVLADRAQAVVYYQDSETVQRSFEDRNTAADRIRENRYGERLLGVNTQFDKMFTTGALAHRFVSGADYSTAFIDNLRTGTVPPAGETFPTKAFADTDYDTLGVFVQDEIALGSSGVFITPALRYDDYSLKPKADALYPGTPTALSDHRVTPKLAVRWRVAPEFTAYANYAQGFRAPTPDQVNNGFTNLTAPGFAYRSIANPNLKPEDSKTIELGARVALGGLRAAVAVFDGRYDGFIAQTTVGGVSTPANPVLFQFVNLGEVKIRGFEARAEYRLSQAWRFEAAYAQAKGDDEARNLPLNSIQPPKFFAGAEWTHRTLSVAAFVNHVREKERDRIDSSGLAPGQTQFATPSFTTLDLTANWRLSRRIEVGAGVFNVFDKKYWNWSDVQGVTSTSPLADAFTQPGRNFAVRARFTL